MTEKVSHQEIIEVLQGTAQRYGTKRMAADLGKAPATLYGELNPYHDDSSRHKLGLEDAMAIMSITEDYDALHRLCAAHGFTMQPVGVEPVAASCAYQHLVALVSEFGDLADALQAALLDGDLSHGERVTLAKEAQDIIDALMPFVALPA